MPSLNKRRWRFHGLKKPKIRQDWNKYNLYNLSRLAPQNTITRTYFQQKWTAKASTRSYHGEVIREKQWERMFSRTANAVVAMDPKYLAEHDGSEHAAGRGSGLELAPGVKGPRRVDSMPYMQMVYHPTERRLDTAVFRALFASSARQARQFVVHGHVKVNGKKMIYPGYLLNPGDMFQVTPERVLFGTGAWKGSWPEESYFQSMSPREASAARDAQVGRLQDGSRAKHRREKLLGSPWGALTKGSSAQAADPEPEVEAPDHDPEDLEPLEDIPEEDPLAATKKQIQSLRARTKTLVTEPPPGVKLSGTRKQELRAFHKTLKQHLSRAASITPTLLDDLETQLQGITSRVMASQRPASSPPQAQEPAETQPSTTPSSPAPATTTTAPRTPNTPTTTTSSSSSSSLLPLPPIVNLLDRTKPYATPWRPRDYMPAFAFIPRYLEVNQNICSAVYLRHPVVKAGLAEVPTPFHPETGQLAFNYYLRRR